MKKNVLCILITGILAAGMLAGCGNSTDAAAGNAGTTNQAAETTSDFNREELINVVSREDGSGTRGAFIELFGIEEKDADGNKIDHTTEEAIITNSTDVMLTTVSGDKYAIGYVSLGSLNDSVKAVSIDGTEAAVDNIKNGSYTIARPFQIATNGKTSDAAQDFIQFILSAEGQKVISDNGYITMDDEAAAFQTTGVSGKIVIAGSSSVSPVMEKLKEAYMAINTAAEIEIQESDSTTGMTAALEGTCDIGMASRELKESEIEGGLTAIQIAMDGIAVVVSNDNPTDELSKDEVKSIFTGDAATWEELMR